MSSWSHTIQVCLFSVIIDHKTCPVFCGDARGLLRLAMRPLRLLLSLSKPGTLITRQEFGASLWQLLQEFTLSYVRLCPRRRTFKQARVLTTRAQTNQTHAYSVRRRSRLQVSRTTTNGVMGVLSASMWKLHQCTPPVHGRHDLGVEVKKESNI